MRVGNGQCKSSCALPICLWAVVSGSRPVQCLTARAVRSRSPFVHCLTGSGRGNGAPSVQFLATFRQWVVELLLCTASLLVGNGQLDFLCALPHFRRPRALELMLCNASEPLGTGPWNSFFAMPHRLRAVWRVGDGPWNSFCSLPHRLWAVSRKTPSLHYLTTYGQCAMELLLCTASLPMGNGQQNFSCALSHCLWAVGSGILSLPHYLWAMGIGTACVQCLTACGH